MITAQRVVKNTIISLGSALSQKILTLVYFVAVARYYGPHDQGIYSSALAFVTLFSVFIDLGVSSAMTREVAREKTQASFYIGQMFFLRIILCIAVYPLMIGIAFMAQYPLEILSLIFFAGAIAVLDTFTIAAWASIRGFQNLVYESFASFLAVFVMAASGFGVMAFGLPIFYLLYALFFGSMLNFFVSMFVLFRRAGFIIRFIPNTSTLKRLCGLSLPFMGAAIFSRIYTFFDMTLLPLLASTQAAGWYAAAGKIMLALNVIPAAFSSSLYPAMSAAFTSQKDRIGFLCSRGLVYLTILVLPIAAGFLLLSDQIVVFLYDASYLPTARVFQLLAPALIAGFLSFPLGAALAAANRQNMNTLIGGVCALVNVEANFLFIRLFAEQGAAIAASLTYGIQFFISLIFAWEYIAPHFEFLVNRIARASIAAGVMALFIFFTSDSFSFFFVLSGSALIYGILIGLLRAITKTELQNFISPSQK